MKRRVRGILFAALLLISLCSTACAQSARPILATAYRQAGWGDAVQIGYIDEAGGLWFISGYDHELQWPYAAEDQLAWIEGARGFEKLGALEGDALFALNSLVQCVENQAFDGADAANDAGTESTYAVRYGAGGAEIIPIGSSGDVRFENADASAQALYLFARASFPDVTSYFGNPRMSPAGFQPVSLMAYRGYEGIDLTGLRAEMTQTDCEEGPTTQALSPADASAALARVLRARVVGKHSCTVTTGGTASYTWLDADGKPVAAFEFYRGLLVMPDGMYYVED